METPASIRDDIQVVLREYKRHVKTSKGSPEFLIEPHARIERIQHWLDHEIVFTEAHGYTERPRGELLETLRRAHNCATLQSDGTCDGCFISEAIEGRI